MDQPVIGRLVVCESCRCHVRAGERFCPHCSEELVVAAAFNGRYREVRRVVMAVAIGLSGCSGPGGGDAGLVSDAGGDAGQLADSGTPSSDPMIVGSCAPTSGAVQTENCTTACSCGLFGSCDSSGRCVNCGCDAGQQCAGAVGNCSTHTCYGAPALLA